MLLSPHMQLAPHPPLATAPSALQALQLQQRPTRLWVGRGLTLPRPSPHWGPGWASATAVGSSAAAVCSAAAASRARDPCGSTREEKASRGGGGAPRRRRRCGRRAAVRLSPSARGEEEEDEEVPPSAARSAAAPSAAAAPSSGRLWDELEDDDGDTFWKDVSVKPPPGQINTFRVGADIATARAFAETRTFAVAPWSQDVKAKPMFAVSDCTGRVAKLLAETAFKQFGSPESCKVQVFSGVTTAEEVRNVVAQAARLAPSGSLSIEKRGAIILYTLGSAEMGNLLAQESYQQGVPCIDALDPVLHALELCLGKTRLPSAVAEGGEEAAGNVQAKGSTDEGMTVFAVSDSSGDNSYGMVCAALRRFQGHGVENVTLCRDVLRLEEINAIVEAARARGSVVVFSFASPGMSRFMRQQCERASVPYADIFQPVLIAFEKYLDYPPVGVSGGHDLQSVGSLAERWETLPTSDLVTEDGAPQP